VKNFDGPEYDERKHPEYTGYFWEERFDNFWCALQRRYETRSLGWVRW
jgi:hypothetical protein